LPSAPSPLLVADALTPTVERHLARGGRALLLARHVFDEQLRTVPQERVDTKWTTFLTGSNYFASQGHTLGSIVGDGGRRDLDRHGAPHPLIRGFTERDWCDARFAGLLWEAPPMRLAAWPQERDGGRSRRDGRPGIEPIVRAIDSGPRSASLAWLFETRVADVGRAAASPGAGSVEGRLLVCSLTFEFGEPECVTFFDRLVAYCSGEEFLPAALITLDELRAVPPAGPVEFVYKGRRLKQAVKPGQGRNAQADEGAIDLEWDGPQAEAMRERGSRAKRK